MSPLPGEGDIRFGVTRSMQDAAVVTPSDGADLAQAPTSALYIGGAGNLRVIMLSGADVLFTAVPAGTWLWLRVKRVMSTNTTATLINALY